jgi:hypothetical protein
MRKFIVVVVIVGAVAYAWHKGWIGEWFGAAVDSGVSSVNQTRSNATKVRPADPGAPEPEKK